MSAVRLSILIPIYNEAPLIPIFLERVITAPASYFRTVGIAMDLIVVDDGSQDDSCQRVEAFSRAHPNVALRLLRHPFNCGKGAAIRTAISFAESDFCLTQDAGLEYDPSEYQKLLQPLLSDQADVVFGSRFMAASQRRPMRFWPAAASRFISMLTGIAAGVEFSDVDAGCVAFRTSLARSIPLRSRRSGLGAELTIQFARRHSRFMEVPISYKGPVHEKQAKGSAWKTLSSVWTILRTWLFAASHNHPAAAILVALSRAKRFNRWMADTITPRVTGEVLELGAGIGNLTVPLSANGNLYVATDTQQEHLSELHSRTANQPNVKLGICDFSKAEDVAPYCLTADTVVCLNTLEHIADDRAALANIYSCLRPGGAVIILVPQGPAAFGSLDRLLEHKRRYTRTDLHEKMAASGFHTIQIIDFNHITWPGWYLNSRLLRRRGFGRLQLFLFDLLVPLWRRIDHLLPWPPNSLIGIGFAPD